MAKLTNCPNCQSENVSYADVGEATCIDCAHKWKLPKS